MLNIKPPDYKFCPLCGTRLSFMQEEGRKRKYCPKCNWKYYPHVFQSSGAIAIKNHKVLLVKRNREPYKNTWMFPAGFVDFGEHPKETAIREMEEETGLTANNPVFIGVYQSIDDPRAPGHFVFFYNVHTEGDLNNKDIEENSKIGWFDINNPPKIGWKIHKELMKRLRENEL